MEPSIANGDGHRGVTMEKFLNIVAITIAIIITLAIGSCAYYLDHLRFCK